MIQNVLLDDAGEKLCSWGSVGTSSYNDYEMETVSILDKNDNYQYLYKVAGHLGSIYHSQSKSKFTYTVYWVGFLVQRRPLSKKEDVPIFIAKHALTILEKAKQRMVRDS